MEAKEKAKELVEKMNIIHYMKLGGKNSKSKGLPISMHNSQRKQCALICVDELINSTQPKSRMFRYNEYCIEYWQEVKHEINKL